ncbi:MAG: hypothetical protein MJ105_06715 [Lachnospiraceae bacterium]|nr:hypothetical protein [Lachnospiraceae bacterium]
MKKIIPMILIILCLLVSGCGKKEDYVFYSTEDNWIGLKSIQIGSDYLEFEIDESMIISKSNTGIRGFSSDSDRYSPSVFYHEVGENHGQKATDVQITQKKNGFIIRINYPDAANIDRVSLGDANITHFECPKIEEPLYGGEVVDYYRQNYNAAKETWDDFSVEEVFFPMTEY